MVASIHNVRICRFFILTCAVALMIFIYATYSSSGSLTTPHMRATSVVSPSAQVQFDNGNRSSQEVVRVYGQNAINSRHFYALHDKQAPHPQQQQQQHAPQQPHHHYRAPTVDVDAGGGGGGGAIPQATSGINLQNDDGAGAANVVAAIEDGTLALMSNNMLEEQYLQAVDNALGNTSSVHTNNNNINQSPTGSVVQVIDSNKIADSEVLIPTSNLQKFIENADKILKNMTAAPPIIKEMAKNQTSAVLPPVKSTSKPTPKPTAKPTPKPPPPHPVKQVVKAPADTTIGIPTKDIYESGHLNEEISIDKICPNKGKDLKLLILIMSAPTHAEARLAIRQTWAHFGMRRDVSTAFMLGRTTNQSISNAMTQENFVYGDLIRGNFIDSYNNLTLKTLSSLEWVDVNCKDVKYVLKTDDDMFINVPKLLDFLDRHAKDKRIIYGRLAQKWKPIRNRKSKYYVSPEQFKSALYPPFTTGPAYVLSSDIVHDLFTRAMGQLYLKLEDVFTTGVVAQQLNIRRMHVNEFLNRRIAFNACNIRKTISVHMIKANEQYDLWKKLLDQSTKCK